MNSQVQRLEALLGRVQRNRQRPRAAPDPLQAALTDPEEIELESLPPSEPPERNPEPPMVQQPVPSAPLGGVVEVMEPRTRPKRDRVPSPLEEAVEQQLQKPLVAGPSTQPMPSSLGGSGSTGAAPISAPAPLSDAGRTPLPLGTPTLAPGALEAPAPAADEARAVAAQPMAQPQRPVAQTVSPHPGTAETPFGELLARSLALRPR